MKTLIVVLTIATTITGVSSSMGKRPTRPVKNETTIIVTESSKVGDKSGWMTNIEDLDLSDVMSDEIILK